MAEVYVTRVERFNAAHKLSVPSWSDEKNRAIFGKCANENWHGHNYKFEITVKGTPDPLTGFVMDAKVLGEIMRREVSDKLDHKNLNLDVPFLKGIQPTAENIAIAIWSRILPHIDNCKLHKVRLYETENIFTDYKGEA
ncbi:MAG: 6-carboxytetrahydropterin synthase [Saprospiraceae bacterium]